MCYLSDQLGDSSMKDYPTTKPPDHAQTRLIIVEANIDVGIVPLVNWLNSFHGIMTRWRCEGGGPNDLPYIVIWVNESTSEFKQVENKLNYRTVDILPQCTQGEVYVYNIVFSSKGEMERIQKKITGQ